MNPKNLCLSLLGLAGGLLLLLGLLLLAPVSTTQAWPVTPQPSPNPPHSRPTGPAFVKPGGSGGWCLQDDPCGSIQYAIDQCEPGNGDTIYIAQGIYTGTGAAVITVTKSITLYGGWDGAGSGPVARDPVAHHTTLDGEGARRGVYISGDITVTLDGFTVTGGDATLLGDDSTNGGGVCVITATITLLNNWVYSNTADLFGGGLYLHESDATLTGNTIYSNTSQDGGGLFLYYGDAALSDNLIYSNAANLGGSGGGGGGLFLYNNNGTLSGNIISGNEAAHVGGGLGVFAGDVVLTNNVVVDNRAGVNGSGIYMEVAQSRLSHTTIAHNTGGDGSGVYVTEFNSGGPSYYSTIAMTNTILVSHTVGITVTAGNTATLKATLWGNGTDWMGGGTILTGTVNLWGDPAFVNPAGGDYHIGPGSAALDAGVDAGVLTDIDGDPRPTGAGYDIGADEFIIKVYLPLVLK